MARKITMNGHFRKSVAEVFEEFVMSKTAQSVSEITIAAYRQHLRSISNHLDIQNIIFARFCAGAPASTKPRISNPAGMGGFFAFVYGCIGRRNRKRKPDVF